MLKHGMISRGVLILLAIISSAFAFAFYSTAGQQTGEILVSAAISLKKAFEEIASVYEKQTGIRARFNLGGSGLLQKQIETGAPVDVFAGAGEKQMDDLQRQGLIFPGTRHNFAGNTLVLIAPTRSRISIRSFADLAHPEVGRISIGSPKTVPAGQYSEEALKNLRLWDALKPKIVLAENVRQVLDYVTRGEVDAGIVYSSDMAGVQSEAKIVAHPPKGLHAPIQYPIAVVKQTGNEKAARRFIDLVLSRTGQAILKKYGFLGSK
jgi:molybdate transport system substrate-binding protein